jgi:hypothetical protein
VAFIREGPVDLRAAGEAGVVGDERMAGKRFERERRIQQPVPRRHDHRMRPAVAGQGHELRIVVQRLGRDADVGLAVDQHLRDLLGRALVQVQLDAGKLTAELLHRHRQRIARLRMRGGDREQAALPRHEFLPGMPQVAALHQHALDDRQPMAAGFGQAGQALAGAHEELDAEFFLEFADLPAHAGLGGVERVSDFGQVEAAAHGFAHRAQLLEIHGTRTENAPQGRGAPLSAAASNQRMTDSLIPDNQLI